MKDTKVQWHPGFVGAMNLELMKNRDDLMFEKEYNLNTKPLEIDLLVIKKNKGIHIENEIGRIFKGHNILEYKSPEDHLDVDTFYKVGAYASLYKSYGETVDSIKADDITVSIVREVKPDRLFKYFEEHCYSVSNPYRGIYYVEGAVLFPTQIVVTKELDRTDHIWLTSLSENLKKQNVLELLESINQLPGKMDREFADSVLTVSIEANKQIVEELIGDDNMCQALMEIMEPKLLLRDQENIEKGKIYGVISVYREQNLSEDVISEKLQEKFGLSEEGAEKYLLETE